MLECQFVHLWIVKNIKELKYCFKKVVLREIYWMFVFCVFVFCVCVCAPERTVEGSAVIF